MVASRRRGCFHAEYINQFLVRPLGPGDRLADLEQDQVLKLDADIFSPENRTAAEKVAKVFYSAAGFDMGEPPKFFAGEFSDEAALFLARVHAALCAVRHQMTPYEAGPAIHDAFVNCWLRARVHGAKNDKYDALCRPWECLTSAIRKVEDMFIACAVKRWLEGRLATADSILDYVRDMLRHEEPELCAGLH